MDQADAAAAIGEFEIDGRLARMRRVDGQQRAEFGFEDAADRVAVEHVGRLPMVLGVERHVFDESQLEAALAGEAGERDDFVFGEAADGDGVEANAFEADVLCGGDAGQHAVEAFAAGDLLEDFFAERVEADVEAAQAGAAQMLRPARRAGCRWW